LQKKKKKNKSGMGSLQAAAAPGNKGCGMHEEKTKKKYGRLCQERGPDHESRYEGSRAKKTEARKNRFVVTRGGGFPVGTRANLGEGARGRKDEKNNNFPSFQRGGKGLGRAGKKKN